MLRLRACVLSHLFSPPSSHIHRLVSATAQAPPLSPNQAFAVEDYLIDTCGLTRAQALKASAKLSHLKSSSKPDAVLAFLASLGLSSADVAVLVARDTKLLCTSNIALASNIAKLTGLGLSRPDIARLVSFVGSHFRHRSIAPKLQYCLPLFGSPENLFRVLQRGSYLLSGGTSLDNTIKPSVAVLRECGLSDCEIAKICIPMPRMLNTGPERVRAMGACAEAIGVPRGSGMFRKALHATAFLSKEKIAAKVDYLKNTFRWSDAEVGIAVCKAPSVLSLSKDSLHLRADFLISEVGLEPAYIAHRSIMVSCSLEFRPRPRYHLVKFLKENRLLKGDPSYFSTVLMSEKAFVEKFVCPHKEAAPHLAEAYAAACRGKVPSRLMIASTKNLP